MIPSLIFGTCIHENDKIGKRENITEIIFIDHSCTIIIFTSVTEKRKITMILKYPQELKNGNEIVDPFLRLI